MKKIFWFLLSFFMLFLLSPALFEGAKDSCHSLEKRLIAKRGQNSKDDMDMAITQLGILFADGISKGNLTRNYISQEMPRIPSSISCALLYWKSYIVLDAS